MKLDRNTILITGGASGIGFALAKRFIAAGSEVIACGRRKEALAAAVKEVPSLRTVCCDIALESERKALFDQVTREFPSLNVLVNNAGIQNRPPAMKEPQDWAKHHLEITTNLEAPMHLSMLFIPHLMRQREAAIINVSSGLAFSPLGFMPVYCATKAALHSFTLSLRHQLAATPIQVIEIVPPAVNTDLGGKGLHTWGVPLDEFIDHTMARLREGQLEFGYGSSEKSRVASREQLDEMFVAMNKQAR